MESAFQLADPDEALQPLLHAAMESKGSNIATIRSIVMKVLTDPDIFCGYNQVKDILLTPPSVVSENATGSDGEKLLTTLDLFSYGQHADYTRAPDKYLPLTDAQVWKLKQLTTLSIIENACRKRQMAVPYKAFVAELQLTEFADVEEIIMSIIYGRAIDGQLCQTSKRLLLNSCGGPVICPRDVLPSQRVPAMIENLKALLQRIDESKETLTQNQTVIAAELENHVDWRNACQRDAADAAKYSKGNNATMNNRAWATATRSSTVKEAGGGEPMDWTAGGGGGASTRRQKRGRGNIADNLFGGFHQS